MRRLRYHVTSMMLINSLLSHANDQRWEEFIDELERLNVRKAVVVCSNFTVVYIYLNVSPSQRLMSSHTIEDLTSCILDFQANIVRVTYRRKMTPVDTEKPSQASTLEYIWDNARLEEVADDEGSTLKWRRLGFDTENIAHEFIDVGVLGLDCLVSAFKTLLLHMLILFFQKYFVQTDPEFFSKVYRPSVIALGVKSFGYLFLGCVGAG
jgi:engulfment and cell motility protein 1